MGMSICEECLSKHKLGKELIDNNALDKFIFGTECVGCGKSEPMGQYNIPCLEKDNISKTLDMFSEKVDKYCGGPCEECGSTNVFSCKEGWECEDCKAEGLN